MSGPNQPGRLIQFTSTVSGEGKSTIANAIASSAAISGLRILLIDTCIRYPALSHRLTPGDDRGLVELLLGTAAPRDVIRYSTDLKCMFLPAGRWNNDPVALLGSERIKPVLDGLRGLFDDIGLDSPPAGRVIDPVVISEYSDQLLYVVRWASTPRLAVRHSIRQLSRYKKPIGIILNHVITP
jgi:capsular exopolysaccharide synthesis family protein